MIDTSAAPPRGDGLSALQIGLLAAASALGSLAVGLYLPGLPSMAWDLGVTTNVIQSTLTLFLAAFAIGQLAAGPLSDQIGRRRTLIVGLGIFVAGSLLCAVGSTFEVVLAGRLIEGFGASVGSVIGRAVVRDRTSGNEATRSLALITSLQTMSPVLGPVVGGLTISVLGWRAAFAGLALAGAVLAIALRLGLGQREPTRPMPPIQLGFVISAYGQTLANHRFLLLTASGAFAFSSIMTWNTAAPVLFHERFELTAAQYGLIAGLGGIGLMIGSLAARRLSGRLTPIRLTLLGLLLSIAAVLGLFVYALIGTPAVGGIVALIFVFSTGIGLFSVSTTARAIATVEPAIVGTASAVLGAAQMALAAVASTAVTLLGSSNLLALLPLMAASLLISIFATQAARSPRNLRSHREPSRTPNRPTE